VQEDLIVQTNRATSVFDAADGNAIDTVTGEASGNAPDPLTRELAAIDALLARTETAIAAATASVRDRERSPLVYEADWDETARLSDGAPSSRKSRTCRRCFKR